MKKPTFKKILAAVVAAAHMSSSFAGSYYLIVPVPSYTSATVGGIAVDPSSLTFSGTELDDSTTRSVTIRNTGQVAQSSPAIAISQNSAEYVVSSNCPETLDVGQSCSADVTYFPVQNTLPGKLRVAYEPVGERLVSLSGQALFDDLEGSKALDFGTVQPGKTAVVSATLSNQGTRTAALNYGSLPSTVTRAGTCSDILPAKTSCDLTFSFKAESESDRTRLDHLFKVQAKNSAAEFQLTAQPLAAGKITGAGAHDYGTLVLGSSAVKTYSLTNVGDVAEDLTPGALPANVARTGTCATSLGAGQSCNVAFTWTPAAAGALNASTLLGDTLFTLKGTAITAAALTDSGSTAFGTVLVGETSVKTVTITNNGQQASSLSYGALPAGVTKTGTCSTTLAGGANCTVSLTWTPAATGNLSANYTVTGTNNTVTLALSGTAQTKANLTKSADADFGTVLVGETSTKTVTVTNDGQQASSLAYGTLPAGVTKGGTCTTSVAGGANCTVTLTWTPTVSGALSASYTITGTNNTLAVALSGSAQTKASLTKSGDAAFGTVLVGNNAAKTITLTNGGQQASSLSYGALPSGMTKSGTCSTTLAGGTNCTVILTWAPTASGALSANYSITGTNNAVTVALSGTAQTKASLASSGSTDFGTVLLGNNAAKTVTITNSGQQASSLTYGALPAGVTKSGTCSTSLAGGANCTVTLTWTPTASGSLAADYTVTGTNNTVTLALSGTAQTKASLAKSSDAAFGTVTVGNTSAKTVTITNSGQQASSLVYGALPTGVTKSGTCSTSLAGGASCTVILTWAPTAAGTLSANYTVTGTNNNLTVALSGTSITPASLSGGSSQAYGTVVVGSSAAKTWTIANSGQATASLTYGTLPAGVTKSGTCATTLAGGASCTVTLTWAPTAAGSLNATYAVGTQSLVMTGTAAAQAPAATLSKTSHAFGSIVVGQSATTTVDITNTGNVALTLAANVGTATAPYAVTDACGTSLAVGAKCTATITYSPTVAAAHNSSVTINTGAAGNKTVTVTGTGITPASLSGGSSQAYGSVVVGSSAAKTWTIANSGQASASLTYGALPANVTKTGTCPTTLAGGASCTVILTWKPTAATTLNATYAVGNQTLTLTGTAVAQAPAATLSKTSHAFGSVVVGQSGTTTVDITNTGNVTLTLPANVGTATAPYAVTDACGTSLAVGAKCTTTITYSPTVAAAHNSSVTINTGAAGNKTVTLTGTGITPASLSGGSSQAYGTVVAGSSVAKTWTIANSGQASASLTYGALPANVTKTGTCTTTLAGGASCTVILTWKPTAATTLNATYTVGTQTLTLTGTAIAQAPAATLSKTSHAFGSIVVGQSATTTVDITNTGNVALTLAANVGTATAPYAVTDACGTSLAVGAKCTTTITYSPTAAAAHNSSVTINAGAAGNKTVTLTGTGITPASLSGGGSQAFGTVTTGSSAAKTWTIANSGGATASLTYGALPANVTKTGTCTTTLAGGASCSVILTWKPTAATTLNATYAVNSQNNSISLGLTGTAVAAGNSLSIGNYSSSSYGYATQYAGFPLAFGSMNPSFPGLGTVTGVFWAGSGSPSITVTFSAPVSASAITISINGVSYRLSAQYSTFFRGSISSAQFNALPKSGTAMIALSR